MSEVEFSFGKLKGAFSADRERDVMRTLRTILAMEHRTTFSADDIFLFGLDRFFPDKVHGIGGFFAKLQHQGIIKVAGHKRSVRGSNHLREIRLYSFAESTSASQENVKGGDRD
jgi:hypothetical protein